MPKKSLQEKTSDVLTEHQLVVSSYAETQQKKQLKQISKMLVEIRAALLDGPSEVSLTDLRSMMREAEKLFKEKFKGIKNSIEEDAYDLLKVELKGQTELLQELIDEYEIPFSVRQPSETLAKRALKDLPLEDQTFDSWFDIWEKKTIGRIKTGLFAENNDDISRADLVGAVFGTGKNPLLYPTFRRSAADVKALTTSLVDGTNSITTDAIANSNTGIIEGIVHNSCLCPTSCISCVSLHGAIRYIDGPDETDGTEIPVHPNCMCFWTYLYKKPNSMSVKVPKTAVSDINGENTPKKFQVWYNRDISEKRKIELFGKTKYEMVKSGEITIEQLLGKRNRIPLTLNELQELGYKIPEK